jgi:hypothetical protein
MLDPTTGETLASEVRIAMLDQTTGAALTLCNTSDRDATLSPAGAFAFGASVAPVDLTISGNQAVALVSWTEGRMLPQSHVHMRFIDAAGCPLGIGFQFYGGPAFAASIAWSEQQHAVLATLHDQRSVYRAWVSSVGPADTVPIATPTSFIYGFPIAAVAPDGSAVVVWSEDQGGPRAILLDAGGDPRPNAANGGQNTSFAIDVPLIAQSDQVEFSASVAVADRFVVGVEQYTLNRSPPGRVMVREYALDGTALGPAYFLDPDDPQPQSSPMLRYAPGGTLVAVWNARSEGGTVGRLIGVGGLVRFNEISCDEGKFLVGARTEVEIGYPSLLFANDNVMVFHTAQGGGDPLGSAAFRWKARFADLWPGPR